MSIKENVLDYAGRWGELLRFVARRFMYEDYLSKASSLVYTTLLSLIPIFTVMFTVVLASPLFAKYNVEEHIKGYFLDVLPVFNSEGLGEQLDSILHQAQQFSTVSVIGMFVTALLLLKTIESTFNEVWCVKEKTHGFVAFLGYWIVLTLVPICIGFGIVLFSTIPWASFFKDHTEIQGFFSFSFRAGLNIVGFVLLYMFVPNCKVRFRDALLGSVAATLLFLLAKWGFTIYMVTSYKSVYGALFIFPVLLVWLYFSWLIVLVGALLTYSASIYLPYKSRASLDPFSHAVLWLGLLWYAQKQGRELSLQELVGKTQSFYDIQPAAMIHTLRQAHLIVTTSSGAYVLERDLSSFSLQDLYMVLPWRLPLSHHVNLPEVWQQRAINQLHEHHRGMINQLDSPVADLYR